MQRRSGYGRLIIIIAIAAFGFIFLAGPRIDITPYTPRAIVLGDDLDAWVSAQEADASTVVPEVKKSIIWADPAKKERTPLSLVYLHGFTATNREISPVMETLSRELGANVFLTRLKGHGVDSNKLRSVHFHDWLYDAEEALAVGSRLGEKVIVVGTSTGGSLAIWLAHHHAQVAGMVLISPNLGAKNKMSEIILLPWGPTIARLVEGEERSYGPFQGPAQNYWTTRYPTVALFPMMAVVSTIRNLSPRALHTPTLVIYTPHDEVVDVRRVQRFYEELGSAKKRIERLDETRNHVLAGGHASPETTAKVIEVIRRFLAEELVEKRS